MPVKNHPLISVKVVDNLGRFYLLRNVSSAVIKMLSYRLIKHGLMLSVSDIEQQIKQMQKLSAKALECRTAEEVLDLIHVTVK